MDGAHKLLIGYDLLTANSGVPLPGRVREALTAPLKDRRGAGLRPLAQEVLQLWRDARDALLADAQAS